MDVRLPDVAESRLGAGVIGMTFSFLLRRSVISTQFSCEIFLKKFVLAIRLLPAKLRSSKCSYSPGLGGWA
jgi:hypothetical protein